MFVGVALLLSALFLPQELVYLSAMGCTQSAPEKPPTPVAVAQVQAKKKKTKTKVVIKRVRRSSKAAEIGDEAAVEEVSGPAAEPNSPPLTPPESSLDDAADPEEAAMSNPLVLVELRSTTPDGEGAGSHDVVSEGSIVEVDDFSLAAHMPHVAPVPCESDTPDQSSLSRTGPPCLSHTHAPPDEALSEDGNRPE